MKIQATKKLIAFIISIMMFSVLPEFTNAQKHCPTGTFPECDSSGKHCKCVSAPRPPCRGCGIAPIYATLGSIDIRQIAINFPLENSDRFSIKMFDQTGRLIKTFGERNIDQSDHQIHWNMKDDEGNALATGIYVLKFGTTQNSEIQKISLVN